MTSRGAAWSASALVLCSLFGCARSSAPHGGAPGFSPAAHFGKVNESGRERHWFAARETEVVTVEAGVAGDRVAALVEVPAASCALFIARGTDGIEDLDLLAYGEDGATLGSDEGADKTPALLVCPPHPSRVYVAARIAAGHGLVAIGAERLPPEDAARAGRVYHVKTGQSEASRLAAWPGLAERIAQHERRLGGKWSDVRRVALPLDARIPTHVSATVESNRCLHALVLPSDELSHIELTALDDQGRILGSAAAFGRDRSLVVCSPAESAVSFELRPQRGRGIAVFVLAQSEEGSANELDDVRRVELFASGSLDDARKKTAESLQGLGYSKAKILATGTLQPGRLASAAFALPRGCSRLDVLGAAPLREVSARLWGADDALLAESGGRNAPVLFACSNGGPVRLDTESLSRPGKYSVELREEAESSPVLAKSPLAAGRLLTHMIEHGVIRSGAQAGKVTFRELQPDRLEHEEILVPLGRCVEVTLALGRGSTGAELRLVDGISGEELALSRGTHVTSARACAVDPRSGGTIHARAEMRAAAGRGEALFTTHMSTPPP